jgi:hypothetical protein
MITLVAWVGASALDEPPLPISITSAKTRTIAANATTDFLVGIR